MTAVQENILSRQIKGLTWGVVLTIITVFGGGAIAIVNELVKVEKAFTKYDNYSDAIKDNKEAIKVTNIRIDNQEGRIYDLANRIKDK